MPLNWEAHVILTQVRGLHRPPVIVRFDPLDWPMVLIRVGNPMRGRSTHAARRR